MRVLDTTSLLVVGAGPYRLGGCGSSPRTRDRPRRRRPALGLLDRPYARWHVPQDRGSRLASRCVGHSFLRGVRRRTRAPSLPIGFDSNRLFLEYATWFQAQKRLTIRDQSVLALEKNAKTRFVASLSKTDRGSDRRNEKSSGSGCRIFFRSAFRNGRQSCPRAVGSHTSDLVRFDEVAGQRVFIVGGRQSAYEWAALLGEHDIHRVDIVHRHDVPRFERVSWRFVDDYTEATMRIPGWWRSLTRTEQEKINKKGLESRSLDARVVARTPLDR